LFQLLSWDFPSVSLDLGRKFSFRRVQPRKRLIRNVQQKGEDHGCFSFKKMDFSFMKLGHVGRRDWLSHSLSGYLIM
jgi:hypothetical protein